MPVTVPHLGAVHPVEHLSNCPALHGCINSTSATSDTCWPVAPSPLSAPCPATCHSITADLRQLSASTSPLPYSHGARKAAAATGTQNSVDR